MKKVINCLHENNPLIKSQLKEVSVEEGMKIATELFEILAQRKDGIGLAANQVGIDAQVAVVNVIEPRILINPQYVDKGNEIPYYEGCLSYPKKGVQTERYKNIIIKTEQEESDWYFSGAPNPSDGRGSWEDSQRKKEDAELRLLETVCVQHEIDHLNGIVCMDRQMVTTIVNEKKVNRNEPCPCGSGKKYKKCCMS